MFNLIITIDKYNNILKPHLVIRDSLSEYLDCIKNIVKTNTLYVDVDTLNILPKLECRVLCAASSYIENIEETYVLDNVYGEILPLQACSLKTIHVIKIDDVYSNRSKFSPENFQDFIMSENIGNYENIIYTQFNRTSNGERQYLNLLSNILKNGDLRNGRNGNTKSIFCNHLKFDLRNGFPLLTTKKMFIRGIIEELLFFIRGDTDSSYLENKGVKIWQGNTSSEFLNQKGLPYSPGVMGPMYGYQWRRFGSPYKVSCHGVPLSDEQLSSNYDRGVDQLSNVIRLIKEDPTSRRILMTDYNPVQAEQGVLYPCHSIILQFYVQDNYLDMFCYNRSQDTFLGVPFNIASSSLLQIIIAKVTGLIPRYFNISMGDAHIYESHKDVVKEQLKRIPYKFPEITINKELNTVEDIEKLVYGDFSLTGYNSHPSIKAKMIA